MLVTLVFDEGITSISLPQKISGQYWIKDISGNQVISIEGVEDSWMLNSNKKIQIVGVNGQDSPYYAYKTKVQYYVETRTVDYKTSSLSTMSGYEKYNTTWAWSGYGSWSNWSTTYVGESDSRKVETRTVDDYTNVNYYISWIRPDGVSAWFNNGGTWYEVYDWNNQMKWNQTVPTSTHGTRDAYTYPEKKVHNNELWYFDSVKSVKTGSHAEYRYCDRYKVYTYYYRKYGEWTFRAWEDTKPIESDTCRLTKTRTVYYYEPK